MPPRLRSEHDREILRLAVPALGALVAEPLYVLVDTAVVGHLGTPQLGGLGVASSILLTAYFLFIFLAYGTTGSVARRIGAGDDRGAAAQAIQGMWLAFALSLVVSLGLLVFGPALVSALGAEGAVRVNALVYLRISIAGVPALFLTMAGTGYLRGLQDTRTPLAVAVVTSVLNLVLQLVLIYGFDQGIGASALSTVVVQWGGAAVYLHRVRRSAAALGVGMRIDPSAVRRLVVVGVDLMVRTAALRGALLVATAVAVRIGPTDLAAHEIAFELWTFLALALDAIAIAGQSITGRLLGAGDAVGARAAGGRMIEWGVAFGVTVAIVILTLRPVLPALFSGDDEVRRLTAFLLLWVAALQPINAVVFVLDGVLIGAGDQHFLAGAMVAAFVAFCAAAGAVLAGDLGIGWLWAALTVLMAARLIPLLTRFQRGHWAVTGAVRA